MTIQYLLHLQHRRGLPRRGLGQLSQLSRFIGRQRLADNLQGFHQPQDLRRQRLMLNVGDHGKFLGGKSYSKQKDENGCAHFCIGLLQCRILS